MNLDRTFRLQNGGDVMSKWSKILRFNNGCNRHHLLFQRKHYNKGVARKLRRIFVYDLDIEIHKELHQHLHDIPLPSGKELNEIYETYLAHKELIDNADILTACEWLATACNDSAWRACMMRQYDFLKSKMDGI